MISLHRFIPPWLRVMSIKLPVRSVQQDSHFKSVLLQDYDFPQMIRHTYTLIPKDEFVPGPVIEMTIVLRWAQVLPLELDAHNVVPIPFIVDTGAPDFMYLGTGCRKRLAQLGLLEELGTLLPNPYPYQLRGTLYRGSNRVFKPPAALLPPQHESVSLINDHRLNLLGLRGIKELGGKLCM